MRSKNTLTAIAALFLLTTFFWFAADRDRPSANNSQIPGWSYATVSPAYFPHISADRSVVRAAVNICYMGAEGCVNEEIRTEVQIGKFGQDNRFADPGNITDFARTRAMEMALSQAYDKMGAAGWEMIAPPDKRFDRYVLNSSGSYSVVRGNINEIPDIYFRKPR